MTLIELLTVCLCVASGVLFSMKFFASYGVAGHLAGFVIGAGCMILIIGMIFRIIDRRQ